MNADDLVKKLLDEVYTGNDVPGPAPEPQGRTMDLGTIFAVLPPGTDEQAISLMNAATNTSQLVKQLKTLLTPHATTLEQIGVVPDYLAWMLTALAQQQRGIP